MSSGLSRLMSPSTLSISTSGPPPLIDSVPRMLNDLLCPGPVPPPMVSPGMAPCNAAAALVTGRSPSTSLIFTCETEPVRFSFFCVPKPTTTTSSRVLLSSLRVMLSGVPFHTTSCEVKPMNDTTRRLPFFTPLMTKSPSIPVTVPLVVPFTTTETPMSVSPLVSLTTPLHAEVCCCMVCTTDAEAPGTALAPAGVAANADNNNVNGIVLFFFIL